MIKKSILFFLLILSCFQGTAQSLSYFKIGEKAFANIDIYSLLYDDETDVLFAATNRGVFSYRENRFNRIKSEKSLNVNSLFQIQSNHKGEIFCCNLGGRIFKIIGETLVLFYEMPKDSKVQSFNYYFDENDDLIVNSLSEIRKINKNGTETVLLNKTMFVENYPNYVGMPLIFSKQLVNGDIYFIFKDVPIYFIYKDGELTEALLFHTESSRGRNVFQLGDVIYYHSNNRFHRIDGVKFQSTIHIGKEAEITQIGPNKIAIRSALKGYRFVELRGDSIKEVSLGIENSFISAVETNSKGTIFLGTFKDGVFVIPNFSIRKQKESYPFTGIASSLDNTVYLSNRKGQLFKYKNELNLFGEFDFNISRLFHLNNKYYIDDDREVKNVIHDQLQGRKKAGGFANLKDVDEYKNEFVFFMSSRVLFFMTNDSIENEFKNFIIKSDKERLFEFPLEGRGKSVTYLEEEKAVYYSTSLGVFKQKRNDTRITKILYKENNILGNNLAHYKGELIIGTEKNGILIYSNDTLKRKIGIPQGLKSNSIIKLDIQDDLLYILSIKGLEVYDLILNEFIFLGRNEGVFSEAVTNFSLSKDKLWLLDKEGYYSYDINQININQKIELGKLYLDSVLINTERVDGFEQTKFSHEENKIEFFFDYRDIETKSESIFKYQLLGVSENWIELDPSINKIEFTSLSPGNYVFNLKVDYRNHETDTITYKFKISAPFWFQLWFVVVMVILIVVAVSTFFLFKMKKNKSKREIESKIQNMKTSIFESKLKAIRSQMNPHFIFNSLNSIQALVLKKDSKRSYDYIEMFSDLVRKTLMFSEKEFIPIHEEVNFLNIYLDLESLRMKSEFTFSVENNFNQEILVPALLIQPFLENAIHHGLLHKRGDKNLMVSFHCENQIGYCSITDNGIGREKAEEINARQKYSHESFSLNAMNERLRILSEQNGKVFSYEIEDLYSTEGTASGTKVTVSFPFKYEY